MNSVCTPFASLALQPFSPSLGTSCILTFPSLASPSSLIFLNQRSSKVLCVLSSLGVGVGVFLIRVVCCLWPSACADNHYQRKRAAARRHLMLTGPDVQLNRLREASDSMMTEYNPNYEFGGGTYTIRDLKDIPREQLRLIRYV